jgi:hypothetical protein
MNKNKDDTIKTDKVDISATPPTPGTPIPEEIPILAVTPVAPETVPIPLTPLTPPIPYTIELEDIMKSHPIPTPYYHCIISSSDTNTSNTSDSSNTNTNTSSDTSDNSPTSDSSATSDNDLENDTTDASDTTTEHPENPLYMIYNEQTEINEEIQLLNYHKIKDCGYWKIAKMIIAHSTKEKNNTEFFLDSLDSELHKNNDTLENIEKVFYTNNLDVDIVYEFKGAIATFIIENLKIFKFKPLGYVFNKDVNQNKWDFTISVITNKSIYTSNRYITENQIGFY